MPKIRLLLTLIAATFILNPVALRAQQCSSWLEISFWETATSADVASCIGSGANLHGRAMVGWTPLHLAAMWSNDPTVIAILTDAGSDLEAVDDSGSTALILAAGNSPNPMMVVALIDAGANGHAQTGMGFSVVDLALRNPNIVNSEIAMRRLYGATE